MSKVEKKKLLVVEDDQGLQSQLRWCFEHYDLLFAEDRAGALAEVRRHEPPVVLQDLGLPPDPEGVDEGFSTLREILAIAPYTKVIVVTGNGDQQNAIRAVALGAYDFYQKPVDTDVLDLIVQRAYQMYELVEQNRRLLSQQRLPLDGIIGRSKRMSDISRLIEKVAPTSATVLLLGETGTGKELLARAIHRLSGRSGNKFVAINCAAIPETLLESELFGYEKGAFTGAAKQTKGKIELADGGTLFLDEIGDMPLALQAKLLRFLQERVLERVGGRQEIPVDVRIVCATHQDVAALIDSGQFRQDLYYRISEIVVNIPPLREREADVVLIAKSFLDRAATIHGKPLIGFTDEAIQAIEEYEWPGNVRELENKTNSAAIIADTKHISAVDLGLRSPDGPHDMALNLRHVRDEAERQALEKALNLADGNISRAADLLGVTRPTLYNLMNKHGISVVE